jgi:hypothetical protein
MDDWYMVWICVCVLSTAHTIMLPPCLSLRLHLETNWKRSPLWQFFGTCMSLHQPTSTIPRHCITIISQHGSILLHDCIDVHCTSCGLIQHQSYQVKIWKMLDSSSPIWCCMHVNSTTSTIPCMIHTTHQGLSIHTTFIVWLYGVRERQALQNVGPL